MVPQSISQLRSIALPPLIEVHAAMRVPEPMNAGPANHTRIINLYAGPEPYAIADLGPYRTQIAFAGQPILDETTKVLRFAQAINVALIDRNALDRESDCSSVVRYALSDSRRRLAFTTATSTELSARVHLGQSGCDVQSESAEVLRNPGRCRCWCAAKEECRLLAAHIRRLPFPTRK